jgi:hypothetical protein
VDRADFLIDLLAGNAVGPGATQKEKLPGSPGKLDAEAVNGVHGYPGEHPHWSGQHCRQKSTRKGLSTAPSQEQKRREAELSCAIFAHSLPQLSDII